MPIYEYQCPDCGYRFEQLQRISDEPIRVCPNCNEQQLRKLVSQTSFVLKGGGWYKDHYGLKGGDGKSESGTAKEAAPASSDKPAATEKPAPAPAPASTETKATPAPPPKKTPSSAA